MKQITLLLVAIAVVFSLNDSLMGQTNRYGRDQSYQEQLRAEYTNALDHAASEAGDYVMRSVASNGKDLFTEALVYEGIEEDKTDGYVSCLVHVVFRARDFFKSNG